MKRKKWVDQEYVLHHSQVVPNFGIESGIAPEQSLQGKNLWENEKVVNGIYILCQIECRAADRKKDAVLKFVIPDPKRLIVSGFLVLLNQGLRKP